MNVGEINDLVDLMFNFDFEELKKEKSTLELINKQKQEIDRLNNIIKLKDDFICDLLKGIYNSEDNELHKRVYLIGTNYEHKLKELKEGK